ncbi:transporter [Actinoplanes sp. NPDC024001]|uniref:transporter n=1 Tax=Actinoplanes sp. NPDC024001 TaxID=3154598 RepID=UPI0033E7B88D
MASINDESSFEDPAEALRLIERERANLERELTPDPRWMYWPWGLAWLIGSGLLFLRYGPDGRVLADVPAWLPPTVQAGSVIIAGIITGVVGFRSGRQVAGPTSRQAAMYGFAWSISFTALSVIFARLSQVPPEETLGILWGGGMVALVGALYMAGAAVWNDRDMFVLGAWISGVNVIGVLLGPGWHALVIAVAGGGGLLVAGLVGWLRWR